MQHLFRVDPQYILHDAKKKPHVNVHPHLKAIEKDMFFCEKDFSDATFNFNKNILTCRLN